MNKKTSQDTAEGASPAAQKPGHSEESELRPGNPVLTVPECDTPAELAKFCDELFPLLVTRPKVVTLRFIGPHEMPPDSALVVHHGLTTRPPGITVVTQAWSPVLGPSLLVWLVGDVRDVRPTASFRFRSLGQVARFKQRRPPWEEDRGWMTSDNEPEPSVGLEDYKTVLRLMDEYLPVDQWAGKIITPAMLRELGLVGHSPLDDLLGQCLARDPSLVPGDSAGEI